MSKQVLLTYYERLNRMANRVEKAIQEEALDKGQIKLTGTEFEDVVFRALKEEGFEEDDISHSPQKFPDFVLDDKKSGKKIGLEVKKTDSAKWEVIGGSIYESLKNDIEETYVIMGKFGGSKPEVRLRKYEECIANLKVTHSPRFYLDMELPEGKDYLTQNDSKDLLELSGDELNRRIRQLLRSNKSTWWSEAETTPFSELSIEEKNAYLNDGMALFPEVFGGNYSNFTPWLIYSCFVWCGNVRDIFSAGGTKFNEEANVYFSGIMNRAIENAVCIKERIENMSDEEVKKFWHVDTTQIDSRIDVWIELVKENIQISEKMITNNKSLAMYNSFSKEQMIEDIMDKYIKILAKALKV